MSKATKSRQSSKQTGSVKPYEGFPLTAHPSGRWCKKHRGKQYYFGPIGDWQAALERYRYEWPYIIAGRVPPSAVDADGLRIRDLADRFLTAKRSLLISGELSERSFADYRRTCELVIRGCGGERLVAGLRADDFSALRDSLAGTRNPTTLSNEINRIRGVFKYACDAGLIESPVRFGPGFARPSQKTIRFHRRKKQQEHGRRMFAADDLRIILDALAGKPVQVAGADEPISLRPSTVLHAMVLLGVNCGLGQSDLSNLPQSAVDLTTGWLDYPRPKTGVERRAPLWPETVDALRAAIAVRPEPRDPVDNKLCFVTTRGARWVKMTPKGTPDDAVAKEFAKVLNALKLKRPGLNFYGLRHTFQTVAEDSRDLPAVASIMGHVDSSMAGLHREGINDDRLRAVVAVVHRWLWPAEK